MVVLRAKLGITVEKSVVDLSGKVGLKPNFLQISTEARSKVWPEETTTGSNIKNPEIGQRNSGGGCFEGNLEEDEEDLCTKILHFWCFFPFPPISFSLVERHRRGL